jgi:hypothetical protein
VFARLYQYRHVCSTSLGIISTACGVPDACYNSITHENASVGLDTAATRAWKGHSEQTIQTLNRRVIAGAREESFAGFHCGIPASPTHGLGRSRDRSGVHAEGIMTGREQLLTVAEVAEWLHISRGWVHDHPTGRRKPLLARRCGFAMTT